MVALNMQCKRKIEEQSLQEASLQEQEHLFSSLLTELALEIDYDAEKGGVGEEKGEKLYEAILISEEGETFVFAVDVFDTTTSIGDSCAHKREPGWIATPKSRTMTQNKQTNQGGSFFHHLEIRWRDVNVVPVRRIKKFKGSPSKIFLENSFPDQFHTPSVLFLLEQWLDTFCPG
jgi:hypothetical protein